MLCNLVKLILNYMAVVRQHKLFGSRRTQIECSQYISSFHNHDCRINCHWFTHKIATCFSKNWITAVAKMKKRSSSRRKDILYSLLSPFQNIWFHTPGWFHSDDLALAKIKRCCFLQSSPFSHWWLEKELQNSVNEEWHD